VSRNLLTVLVMLLLLVGEGVLHARTPLAVDVGAVILAYLVLERSILGGAAMALILGYFEDLRSGVPTGLFAAASVMSFLVLRVAVAKLRWTGVVFSSVVALGATWLVTVLVVAIDAVLGEGQMSVRGAAPSLLSMAISTIVLCYPVHRLLARIDERLDRPDDEFVLR
jgi:cell shape-determining protein MreD